MDQLKFLIVVLLVQVSTAHPLEVSQGKLEQISEVESAMSEYKNC